MEPDKRQPSKSPYHRGGIYASGCWLRWWRRRLLEKGTTCSLSDLQHVCSI